jgi:hypothetical protein
MEALKIAFTCVIAAVIYGIVHDQFTARICLEYFTVFHRQSFTRSLQLCSGSDGESLRRGGSEHFSRYR